MNVHYLRFPDEPTGMAALEAAGFLNDDGEAITATHTHAIDVIGPIFIGGEYDPETGEVITPPTLLDGWHINYQGDLPDGWDNYLVTPQHPCRVFAPSPPETMLSADGTLLVRARDELGRYLPDDPTTPDADEAWVEAE